jgi:hypothetical protein
MANPIADGSSANRKLSINGLRGDQLAISPKPTYGQMPARLAFDMTSRRQVAKLPVDCPVDGGVRQLCVYASVSSDASTAGMLFSKFSMVPADVPLRL